MAQSIGDIIDHAVAIELECAALYEVFARAFSGTPELVYFWRLYAEAERYHAASIRIHQAAFASVAKKDALPVGVKEARKFLDQLKVTRLKCEKKAPTVKEALRIARDLEDSSAELHARTQFFKLYPEMAELFAKMSEEDRAHRDVLKSAEEKFAG